MASKQTRDNYGGHVTVEHTTSSENKSNRTDRRPQTRGKQEGEERTDSRREGGGARRGGEYEERDRREGRRGDDKKDGGRWERRDRKNYEENRGGSRREFNTDDRKGESDWGSENKRETRRRDYEDRGEGGGGRREGGRREGRGRFEDRRGERGGGDRWDGNRRRDQSEGGGDGEGSRRWDNNGRRENTGRYERRYDGRRDNRAPPPRRDTRFNKSQRNQETSWGEEHVTIETTVWGDTKDPAVVSETPPSPTPPTTNSWSHDDWVMVDVPTEVSFPEAIETAPTTTVTATPHQDSDVMYSNYTDDKRVQLSPAVLDDSPDSSHKVKATTAAANRRFKSSQIPVQPVEMPNYTVESLKLELGSLGIDFVGSEATPTTDSAPSPSSAQMLMSSAANQIFSDIVPSQGTSSLLTSTSNFSEDAAVIAISTNLSSSFSEAPPTKLDPPPGLTHPSHQQHSGNVSVATSGLLSVPPDQETPHDPPSVSVRDPPSVSVRDPASVSVATELFLPPITSAYTSSLEATPHTVSTVAAQSQPLFTTQPTSVAMVTNPTSSHHGPPTATSSSGTSHRPSTNTHTGSNTGKVAHSSVLPMAAPPTAPPTGMVYPPMLHQFPHYGTAPMMIPPAAYPYDVETLNRSYQGFYSQHQAASDSGAVLGGGGAGGGANTGPTASQGGISRDHSSNTFGSDMKYEMASPVVTQQQQGALQNPFYSPYIYATMYNPHLSMAAGYSAQMNHKGGGGGGGSTYPTGTTTYQQAAAAQGQYAALTFDDEAYSKLYSGGAISKSNSASSTSGTGTDYTSYTKQYDTKGGPNYGSYVPSAAAAMGTHPMGGYMMPPHLMTTPLDNTSRSKHSKYNSGWTGHT